MIGHTVFFENFSGLRPYLDEAQTKDFIDMMFRGNITRFTVDGGLKEGRIRGRHSLVGSRHHIELSPSNIIRDFEKGLPIGGNLKPVNRQMAIFMTFAHELQHANQTLLHSTNEGFFRKPGYRRRPCEVDARLFVDDQMQVIASFLGIAESVRRGPTIQARSNQDLELVSLAEDLGEFEQLSVKDILEELRGAGLANPVNVGRIRQMLMKRGVEITK